MFSVSLRKLLDSLRVEVHPSFYSANSLLLLCLLRQFKNIYSNQTSYAPRKTLTLWNSSLLPHSKPRFVCVSRYFVSPSKGQLLFDPVLILLQGERSFCEIYHSNNIRFWSSIQSWNNEPPPPLCCRTQPTVRHILTECRTHLNYRIQFLLSRNLKKIPLLINLNTSKFAALYEKI